MNTTINHNADPFATPLCSEDEILERKARIAYFCTADAVNALRTQMRRTPDDQRLRVAHTAAREAHTALIRLREALEVR